jgi:hypothetical protein
MMSGNKNYGLVKCFLSYYKTEKGTQLHILNAMDENTCIAAIYQPSNHRH